MTHDMGFDLKLPAVGELTFPQWQDWLARYNAVLAERDTRIEELEKYQSVHAQCDKTSLELEEKLVKQLGEAHKRIQMLEAALTHIYAWYPISIFNPNQTIKEIKVFARQALEVMP